MGFLDVFFVGMYFVGPQKNWEATIIFPKKKVRSIFVGVF